MFLALGCSSDEGGASTERDGGDASSDTTMQVGFAMRDVSPTDAEIAGGEVFLGAYGLLGDRLGVGGSYPATGVHDPVYSRTLVIKHGEDAIALTIVDMPGMSNRVIRAVVAAASDATGMEADSIYVGSTHSHSAPDLQGLWGGVPDGYRQRIIDLAVASIVEASENTEEAEIFVSSGTAPNRNRRGWDVTDEDLTVLDAKTPSGDRIATLIQFAAHPVKLGAVNLQISRDFPGYTVDHAEAELGAPVLYFNGIIGDCSPDGGEQEPGCALLDCEYQQAESYGVLIAEAAISTMNAGSTKVSSGITASYETWEQEVTNAGFLALMEAGVLDYDGIPRGDSGMGIETQGAYFRLGTEVQAVAFPGEALTRTGLAIKDQMKTEHRLFLGLTTDSLGYFVRQDEWMTGRNENYEETVSMGETAGERSIEVIGGLVARDNDRF